MLRTFFHNALKLFTIYYLTSMQSLLIPWRKGSIMFSIRWLQKSDYFFWMFSKFALWVAIIVTHPSWKEAMLHLATEYSDCDVGRVVMHPMTMSLKFYLGFVWAYYFWNNSHHVLEWVIFHDSFSIYVMHSILLCFFYVQRPLVSRCVRTSCRRVLRVRRLRKFAATKSVGSFWSARLWQLGDYMGYSYCPSFLRTRLYSPQDT